MNETDTRRDALILEIARLRREIGDLEDELAELSPGSAAHCGPPAETDADFAASIDGQEFDLAGSIDLSPLFARELTRANEKLRNEITERLQAEAALKNSEKRYRELVENATDILFQTDSSGILTMVNRAALRITGYSEGEFLGKHYLELVHPDRRKDAKRFYDLQFLKRVHDTYYEYPMNTKDGKTIWLGQKVQLMVEGGRIVGLQSICRDITSRREAEEAARASEERFRDLVDLLPQFVYELDAEGMFTFINKAGLEETGYTWEDISMGLYVTDLLFPEDCERARQDLIHFLHSDDKPETEYTVLRKDGSTLPLVIYISRITRDGRTVGIRGVGIDITERKHAEDALRQSEEQYRTLFEGSRDGIYIADRDGRLLEVNPSFLEILGFERNEMIGSDFGEVFADPQERTRLRSAIELAESVKDYEVQLVTQNRAKIDCLITSSLRRAASGNVVGDQGIVRDITESKLLEQQLLQAQKMEALGTLAGGIAHDFNNILYAMMGFTELALAYVQKGTRLHTDLEAVLQSGERARDLVRQILTFSRRAKQERIPIDVASFVKEIVKFMRASLPATIEIRHQIRGSAGTVMADPTQMHQVLINLCANAGHAMREKGGILNVALDTVDLDPRLSLQDRDLSAGTYVRLTVSDTGKGMTPEVMRRIFEPYFTTKAKGEGTGLGLAVVHGIVKSYGGTITVESEPGVGSTFRIYVPAMENPPAQSSQVGSLVPRGRERLLFVDDEPQIVEIGKEVLERLGYSVTGKTSSVEALKVFQTQPSQFDLIVTDMTMPVMTGIDLVREIRAIHPDIPIVLSTGYSEMINDELIQKESIQAIVMKPVTMEEMAATVRQVLDNRPHG